MPSACQRSQRNCVLKDVWARKNRLLRLKRNVSLSCPQESCPTQQTTALMVDEGETLAFASGCNDHRDGCRHRHHAG